MTPCALAMLLCFTCTHLTHAQFQVKPLLRDSCQVPAGLRVLEVIDATEPTIGQVYHGSTGSYVNASLAPSTQVWVRDALKCDNGASREDVILRLTRMSLAESSSGVAVRTGAYVDLEVFQRNGDNWLLRYRTSCMADGNASLEDTERHGRTIANALAHCLNSYAKARSEGQLLDSAFIMGEAELLSGRALGSGKHRYPILRLPQLPKGVFRSADAFKNGDLEPVADTLFRMDGQGNIHLKGELKKERDALWGVSDGTRYHVRLGRKFVPLDFDGTHFNGTVVRSYYTMEEQVALGFMFGAVGMLIMMPIKEHVPARLDLASGQLLPLDVDYGDTPVDHIIHLSRFADAGTSITVVHGMGPIVLERDTYCKLQFPLSTASELVRVTGPGGEIELALPLGKPGSHFHLIDVDAHGLPAVKKVNEQMEVSLRGRLRSDMLRPLPKP